MMRYPFTEKAQVTLSEIAQIAGVSASAVSNWKKRYGTRVANQESLPLGQEAEQTSFPQPAKHDDAGNPIYDLQEVFTWLLDRDGHEVDHVVLFRVWALFQMRELTLGSDEATRLLCSLLALRAWGEEHLELQNLTLHETAEAAAADDQANRAINLEALYVREKHAADVFAQMGKVERESRIKLFDDLLDLQEPRRVYTAESIVPVVTGIASLGTEAKTVLDPGAGTCELLAGVWEASEAKPDLVGYEIDPDALRIGLQRLLVVGVPTDGIKSTDGFEASGNFDLVLSDPPVGLATKSSAKKARTPRHSFEWVDLALELTAPEGKAICLVPFSSLSGRSTAEHRGELVNSGALEAVITLAPGRTRRAATFMPATILVMRGEDAADPDSPVLFLDAQTARQIPASAGAVVGALAAWRDSGLLPGLEDGVRGVAVDRSDLKGRDGEFSLLFSRVIAKGETTIDTQKLVGEMEGVGDRLVEKTNALPDAASLTAPDFDGLEPERWSSLRELIAAGELEVLPTQIRNRPTLLGSVQSENAVEIASGASEAAGTRSWAEFDTDTAANQIYLTRPGDVLISIARFIGGTSRIQAHVETRGGRALTQRVSAVRLRREGINGITPLLLKFLIEGEENQIASIRNFTEIRIPVLSEPDASRISTWLEGLESTVRAASVLADEAALAVHTAGRLIESGGIPK
ncbi:MAG: hypothetical protein WCH97_04880 [Actinomycetes bacterium]